MGFLIAATFKSNKTRDEVREWVQIVAPVARSSSQEVAVAPSFPYLSEIKGMSACAQDVSSFPQGSYTGAVNAAQLKDNGVKYCIVGHSERRRYFHESHADVANKVRELLSVGIIPILCVTEDDIFPQLSALENAHKDKVIYCFEPVAQIGGTETASLDEIKRVVGLLRKSVEGCKVMYGGSVNAGNCGSLIPIGIDGVLVSSASLDPASFVEVIHSVTNA